MSFDPTTMGGFPEGGEFSFGSDHAEDENGLTPGTQGYDFYYNKELHKALADLQQAEAAYEPIAGKLTRESAGGYDPATGIVGGRPRASEVAGAAPSAHRIGELFRRIEKLELRDLRRLAQGEHARPGQRLARWDFRRVLCRVLGMPLLPENEAFGSMVFDLYDKDTEGTTTWLQAATGLCVIAGLARGETLRVLLELCDANKDGWLNYDEVMSMLKAVQERRMVDEQQLRYAISDAGAIRVDDFYKWPGKEVLLEWIDRYSSHFELKVARLKSPGGGRHPQAPQARELGVVVAPGATGDKGVDTAIANNLGHLMSAVTYKEIRGALRDVGAKVSNQSPCGEPQLRQVFKKLLPFGGEGHLGALSSLGCAVIRASGGQEDVWWDAALLVCGLCEEARADPVRVVADLCDLHNTYRIDCKALTAVVADLDENAALTGMTHALWSLADGDGAMKDDALQRWEGLALLRAAVTRRLALLKDQIQMMAQRLASAYNPPLRITHHLGRVPVRDGWGKAVTGGSGSGYENDPWAAFGEVAFTSF